MKRLLSFTSILLIQLPLLGCAGYISGIQDHNTIGSIWKGPSSSNNYVGQLAAFSDSGYPQVEQRAIQNCSSYGGLNGKPTKFRADNSLMGTTYWSYQCNGPQAQIYSPQPVSSNQSIAPLSTPSLSIDKAKAKCTDLGFKQGTEGFGKCVLQFSK